MRVAAYVALASAVPVFFLGVPEASCGFITLSLAVFALFSRRSTP